MRKSGESRLLENVVKLLKENKSKKALELVEKLIYREPENADLWEKKGIALRLLGKNKESLEAYDKAISLTEKCANAWFNRGIAFKHLAWTNNYPEGHQEAMNCFRQAIKYDPKHLNALMCLGNVLVLHEKFREGKDTYNKALQNYPEEPDVWCNYSFACYRAGEYKDALKACEKSLSINPYLPNAWCVRSACLKSMGKEEEARKAFTQATALNPEIIKRAQFENVEDSLGPCLRDEVIV